MKFPWISLSLLAALAALTFKAPEYGVVMMFVMAVPLGAIMLPITALGGIEMMIVAIGVAWLGPTALMLWAARRSRQFVFVEFAVFWFGACVLLGTFTHYLGERLHG